MEKRYLRNHEITVPRVLVIGDDGKPLGEMPTSAARRLAEEQFLDLVQISPNQLVPVCKIIDFGAFLYKEKKRQQANAAQSKTIEIKEIRLRPGIDDGDFKTKAKQASGFLEKGHKVKLSLRFKGREISHAEIGADVLRRFGDELVQSGIGLYEVEPKMDGRQMFALLSPKKQKKA